MRRTLHRSAFALCAAALLFCTRAGAGEEDEEYIVEVLTTTGQPLSGVRVLPSHSGYWVQYTDANGRARFPWRGPEQPKKRTVVIGDGTHDLAPAGSVTRHRMDPCPGLRVDVVSATTGEHVVPERVRLRLSNLGYIDIPRVGGDFRLTAVSVQLAAEPEFSVVVDGPDGYADAEVVAGDLQSAEPRNGQRLRPSVSALADPMVVTVALRPATTVTVRAVNEEGKPLAGAVVDSVHFKGSSVELRSRHEAAGADGLVVLRKLPRMDGERIIVELELPNSDLVGKSPPLDPSKPPKTPPDVELMKEFGPGWSGGIGRGSQHARSPLHPRPPLDPVKGADAASVEVLVQTAAGKPARNVAVRDLTSGAVARTDGAGKIVFEGLASGDHDIDVAEPGFVYAFATVSLQAGKRASITLDEPTGRAAKIIVVDPAGKPVPFASVRVGYANGFAFAVRSGGEQPLTLYTNRRGWLVLGGLPPFDLEAIAALGTRAVRAAIPGDAREVRMELPAARFR